MPLKLRACNDFNPQHSHLACVREMSPRYLSMPHLMSSPGITPNFHKETFFRSFCCALNLPAGPGNISSLYRELVWIIHFPLDLGYIIYRFHYFKQRRPPAQTIFDLVAQSLCYTYSAIVPKCCSVKNSIRPWSLRMADSKPQRTASLGRRHETLSFVAISAFVAT